MKKHAQNGQTENSVFESVRTAWLVPTGGETSIMEDRVETIMNIERYIACLNIEHYKKLLETDIDETKRKVLMQLLAKEQTNLLEAISKAKAHDQTEKDLDQKSAVNA
jgi:sugar-specific transcriptional regulator TrmB